MPASTDNHMHLYPIVFLLPALGEPFEHRRNGGHLRSKSKS